MLLRKLFFVLFSILFCQVQAQERITDFDVKVQIEKSGNIEVVENITINAEGNVFKHGLLRTFPLIRKDKDGDAIDVQYTINSIKKDGSDEEYFTKEEGGNWKIYIGNKDVELQNGIYKYQINYSVPFQIGYFDHYDELYWNVTGNGWDFPIDKATCRICLPSENNIFNNLHCYTGQAGSTASNCISSLNDNKTIVTFSAVQLGSNEGLTVAASFAKGIVDPPTFIQESASFYKKIKAYLWSAVFGPGMLLFFFFSWKKHGKDPVNKILIPEFSPPYGWSPAIVGYVYNRGVKDKTYMASVINACVKGAVKISSSTERGVFTNKHQYEIEVLDKESKNISAEEADIISSFSKKDKIKVNDSNYEIFDKAYSKWLKTLTKQINLEEFYQNNTLTKWIAFAVFVIAGLIYAVLSQNKGYINYPFYSIFILATALITYWFSKKAQSEVLKSLPPILALFIFVPAVFIFVATIFILGKIQIIVTGIVFLTYIIYAKTLGRCTEKGGEALYRLKGFKLYLKTAEKDRMNALNPPELTPQLFEKLFPYAIALGVELEWGKQFEKVLELAKYNPDWYQGNDDTFYRRLTMFLSGFENSVSKSRVDPSPPASSGSLSGSSGSSGSWSSGSSGGGSSGGGGGGGGGGGW